MNSKKAVAHPARLPELTPLSDGDLADFKDAAATLTQMAQAYLVSTPKLQQIIGPAVQEVSTSPPESGQLDPIAEKHRKAEARYRTLVEQIPAVTFMASLSEETHELYVSPQIEGLLGFSPEQWISDPIRWFHQIHLEDQERMSLELARICISGGPFRGEFRVLNKGGEIVWVHCEARLVRDDRGEPLFLQGVAFDITETKTAEEKVRASLREKETLLKEIHHRVKNNLQITSSLLKLQSAKIEDKAVLRMFVESENRIRSMALVHEKLYRAKDLEQVNFAEYIRDLATYLSRSYGLNVEKVKLNIDVEAVFLGIDTAIPCGLILNELISNCIKHAFTEDSSGEIQVLFKALPSTPSAPPNYQLKITDNGRGIPPNFDIEKSRSLGLNLVASLTRQLTGKLAVKRGQPGTSFEVVFPRPKAGR